MRGSFHSRKILITLCLKFSHTRRYVKYTGEEQDCGMSALPEEMTLSCCLQLAVRSFRWIHEPSRCWLLSRFKSPVVKSDRHERNAKGSKWPVTSTLTLGIRP